MGGRRHRHDRDGGADAFKMICLGANGVFLGKILIQLLGCVGNEQGRCNACSTGRCPTGICTQDPRLVHRLDVDRGAQNIVDYMLALDGELRKLMAPHREQFVAGGPFRRPCDDGQGRGRQARHPIRVLGGRDMLTIKTLQGTHRMSTQDLLLAIEEAVGNGETSFEIEASGQHDIGGPLWNREGKALRFHVTNPGQRVGSMCLGNTEILVDGPAPADVGWLNAGGRIVVRGDAGDTAGHCAAAGVIHIGGRAGPDPGSLMKHDPLLCAPGTVGAQECGQFFLRVHGRGQGRDLRL